MLFLKDKRSLATLAQWSEKDLCHRHDEPGVGTTDAALVDYSQTQATPDQQHIEEVLASRDLRASRLLHVGVGDSGLARRLGGLCASIDGITVSEEERQQAESLQLPNYRVMMVNKYTRDFVLRLQPGYSVIVDNNPASFACCAYHFALMLDNYRWALAPGGEMLTHQRGMRWVAGDRRWRMTFEDLAEVGRRFDLEAVRLTSTVYSLRRA